MNRDAADAVLFGESLSCEETQRAAFVAQPVDEVLAEAACVRAEACLRAIATIEDTGGEEDDAPLSPALRRIEARLELVMTLLGAKLRQDRADPLTPIRWSALGARMPVAAAPADGSPGLFRIQATSWLPEPLELPATVIASQPGPGGRVDLWLRFGPLTEAATSALERHLFRQHRRAIANRRARAEGA
jgi:hypothetical protein